MIARKKMTHQVRSRGDPLLADFLLGFTEAHGSDLQLADLHAWENLMMWDDQLIMNLVSGAELEAESVEVDVSLFAEVLEKLKAYLVSTGPRSPFAEKW